MIEHAQKLGGILIKISQNKTVNYGVISYLDRDFPFHSEVEPEKKCAWITLFTRREILLIHDQVSRKSLKAAYCPYKKAYFPSNIETENKQLIYIRMCLDFLLKK